MSDWRERLRPRAVELLEACEMEPWERFLISLIGVGSDDEITAWAKEVLASTSHDAQVYWLGRCECTDHLLN